jgi:hypothetical protein
MDSKKSTWQMPELIVLARSRTEEAVLTACKFAGTAGFGRPAAQACAQTGTPCSAIAAS